MKIVDGINMEKVKAQEVKAMIAVFNKAKLGAQIKPGANPLGSAKAFVKAVEALDEDKQGALPEEVQEYYNLIVVSDEELAKQQEEEQGTGESNEQSEVGEEEAPPPPSSPTTEKKTGKAKKPKGEGKAPFGRDPNKPTKKSVVIAMVSKGKGATLDEMAKAMTEAGLGEFDRNKTTAKLWIPKLGFKVRLDEKTGRYSKE